MTIKPGDDSVTTECAANKVLQCEAICLHSIRRDNPKYCKFKFGLNKICVYKSNHRL